MIPMTEKAIFGAGCFWGVQHSFAKLIGVLTTQVGYCGGNKKTTNYSEVCTGTTGHAEVVLVKYDPNKVSYEQLLQHFFAIHNPTLLNRQGHDEGEQYRSAIFFTNEQQQRIAQDFIRELQLKLSKPIVTQVAPENNYVKAEEYHQNYLVKNGHETCKL